MLTQSTHLMSTLPAATASSHVDAPRPELHYPLGEQLPALGSATEVAPGIFWLRMGLPFALNHINLWLMRDRMPHPAQSGTVQEGWTVVDCGIDNPATREDWLQVEEKMLKACRSCACWPPTCTRITWDWRIGCANVGKPHFG